MKTPVIPSEVRDLSTGRGLCKLYRVIRAPWVRSLALLGMTAWFVWLLLPKPPLLDEISFSQCVRDRNGKIASNHPHLRSEIPTLDFFVRHFARADRFDPPV